MIWWSWNTSACLLSKRNPFQIGTCICFSVLQYFTILGLALSLSNFLFYAWTIIISVFLSIMLIFYTFFEKRCSLQNEIWEQQWHEYGYTSWQKLVSSNFLPTTCNHTQEMHHDFEKRTSSIIRPLITSYSIAMFASLFTVIFPQKNCLFAIRHKIAVDIHLLYYLLSPTFPLMW